MSDPELAPAHLSVSQVDALMGAMEDGQPFTVVFTKKNGDERYNQGVEDGYNNKRTKGAMAPVSGTRSKSEGLPTPKEIGEMSLDEYRKVRDKVLKANRPT